MSEKLYGAKCYRCGCIEHFGREGLEADPPDFLEPRGLECARCTFCQERALSRAIQEAGLLIFAPEVREAVEMFKRGDTSHPITQSLRAECLAIEAEGESGTPEAQGFALDEHGRAWFSLGRGAAVPLGASIVAQYGDREPGTPQRIPQWLISWRGYS